MHKKTMTGTLSNHTITLPDPNFPPMPALAPAGVILNGVTAKQFGAIDSARGYPDVRSFKRKFGLLIPATNTSMEHELWSIIFKNQGAGLLDGVGIHTSNVITPAPKLATVDDLHEYRRQFLDGLKTAIDAALLAQPEYLIMGMSLEHIIHGLDAIRQPMQEVENHAACPVLPGTMRRQPR